MGVFYEGFKIFFVIGFGNLRFKKVTFFQTLNRKYTYFI